MDHALGCFMGSCIGDAGGASLEFLQRTASVLEVADAFQLPGGGPHALAPGQITDDNELAIALAHGIIDFALAAKSSGSSLSGFVAPYYEQWMSSEPFDIGTTTSNALKAGAAQMISRARILNPKSLSNGFLMRSAPLAIFCAGRPVHDVRKLCALDLRLTHSHPFAIEVLTCFIVAASELIATKGDRKSAIAKAESFAKTSTPKLDTETVASWLKAAKEGKRIPCFPNDGYSKIAFIEAFRHLYRGTGFMGALMDTCSGGGDTDTNCAIVGIMIGAADGLKSFPHEAVFKVLCCDTRLGRPRPDWLSASTVPMLTAKLYNLRGVPC